MARCRSGSPVSACLFFIFSLRGLSVHHSFFNAGKYYGRGFPAIRKIIARIRKMMMSHFPIAHAILPINPRITNITAIMMNSIPSVKSQSSMVYHLNVSVHSFGFIICVELGSEETCVNESGLLRIHENRLDRESPASGSLRGTAGQEGFRHFLVP